MSDLERHPSSNLPFNNKTDPFVTKTPSSIWQKNLNRRQFNEQGMRLLGGIFGLTLLGPPPSAPQEIIGPQYLQIDNAAFIDFGEEYKFDFMIQEEYPVWEDLKRELLGNHYIEQLDFWNELIAFVEAGNSKEDFADYLLETNTPFALFMGLQDKITNHAFHVVRTHTNILKEYGYNTVPRVVEVQPSYTSESLIKDTKDKLGNKGIAINTTADHFIEALAESDESIINISFQLGKLRIYYARNKYKYTKNTTDGADAFEEHMAHVQAFPHADGTSTYFAYDSVGSSDGSFHYRRISVEEYVAYRDKALIEGFAAEINAEKVKTSEPVVMGAVTGEEAEANVLELLKLVDAYPEKLFIVAAGNYHDDWRPVREKLKDRWPKNLLVAGQWNSDTTSPDGVKGQIHGADIYVDMAHFGMPGSRPYTSNATAILSAIANMLKAQGRHQLEDGTMPSVKETLLRATKLTQYDVSDENLQLHDVPNTEALALHYFERPKELARVLDKDAIDEIIRSGVTSL